MAIETAACADEQRAGGVEGGVWDMVFSQRKGRRKVGIN
jgi:hypothetical protein